MKKIFTSLMILSLALILGFSQSVFAAVTPSASLTNIAGGITSITGTPATSGTESGVHTITISAGSASTIVSNDIESNGAADNIAVTINAANDDVTAIIAGKTLTFDLAAATADVTTLVAVAADLQTKINNALIAQDMPVTVAVTVTGASPGKTLLITVGKAGLGNSITSINGGGATALTFLNAAVAGVDAKAVDVFVAATGSNGLWVAANPGSTKTITNMTSPGTASSFNGIGGVGGLKAQITTANAIINGVTLVAAGDVSAGAPAITVTAGTIDHYVVTGASATPAAGATDELTITAKDASGNTDLTYAGAKTLIFSGLSNASTGQTSTIEAIAQGSDNAITFTDGVSNAGAATLIAYKAESGVSVDVADKAPGTVTSAGSTSYDLDLVVDHAAAANHLDFEVQPSSVNYRAQNFLTQPRVRVQDIYGNNFDTVVAIALAENAAANCGGANPAGTLTGTPVNTAATGLATFLTAQFDTTSGGASYYLKATSAGLADACSTGFTIVSGTASTPASSTYVAPTTTTTTSAATTTTTTVATTTQFPVASKTISSMTTEEKTSYLGELKTFLVSLLQQIVNNLLAAKK